MDRQAQHLVGELLRNGEVATVEMAERRVLVERQAIEQAGADARLVELRPHAVAIGNANGVEREGAGESPSIFRGRPTRPASAAS